MSSIVILILLWMSCIVSSSRCPKEESLAPSCMCKSYGSYSMMVCNRIMNAEELIPPVKATDGYDIMSLNIEDSSLMYIPSELFKNTKFEKIRFGNTQIMSLSDSELAFEGLEDHLEELRATGAQFVTTWDWSQLRNHRRLKLVDVNMISMHSLDNEFPPLESMTHLGISKAEISFIHPTAFQGLPNILILVLKQNDISQMSRSMLPTPANKLYIFDLSDNALASLPEDMFTKMPSLKEVVLSNNKLVTLNKETFSQLFQSLQSLFLQGNKFRCDCRLRWMVGIKIPMYFEAKCNEPESLHGNNMRYLKHSDLWC